MSEMRRRGATRLADADSETHGEQLPEVSRQTRRGGQDDSREDAGGEDVFATRRSASRPSGTPTKA